MTVARGAWVAAIPSVGGVEGWAVLGLALILVIGLAGLTLGIRAELRARYRAQWLISERPYAFLNCTGEDASDVEVVVLSGGHLVEPARARLVRAADLLRFSVRPDTSDGVVVLRVRWTRTRTGRRYIWPPSAPHSGRRARR